MVFKKMLKSNETKMGQIAERPKTKDYKVFSTFLERKHQIVWRISDSN